MCVSRLQVFSDFLGDQTSIQQMNMDVAEGDAVREWLLGFDKATLKHGMTMQMCMQLPSNLMQVGTYLLTYYTERSRARARSIQWSKIRYR